ncbi:hypothetical protein TARUN_9411 [Trichoderma arundinaceum]|uniref:Uncharacterized protein n=1 Tax=Trichoderma arundinaceum TaxID=490622 RepID=A0A395N9N4_TRIAR|nr:hypothetical protein TARUN_9411 [Trichoderma arundinaceum]
MAAARAPHKKDSGCLSSRFLTRGRFLVLASPLSTVASLVPTGWRVSSVAVERARQMANEREQGGGKLNAGRGKESQEGRERAEEKKKKKMQQMQKRREMQQKGGLASQQSQEQGTGTQLVDRQAALGQSPPPLNAARAPEAPKAPKAPGWGAGVASAVPAMPGASPAAVLALGWAATSPPVAGPRYLPLHSAKGSSRWAPSTATGAAPGVGTPAAPAVASAGTGPEAAGTFQPARQPSVWRERATSADSPVKSVAKRAPKQLRPTRYQTPTPPGSRQPAASRDVRVTGLGVLVRPALPAARTYQLRNRSLRRHGMGVTAAMGHGERRPAGGFEKLKFRVIVATVAAAAAKAATEKGRAAPSRSSSIIIIIISLRQSKQQPAAAATAAAIPYPHHHHPEGTREMTVAFLTSNLRQPAFAPSFGSTPPYSIQSESANNFSSVPTHPDFALLWKGPGRDFFVGQQVPSVPVLGRGIRTLCLCRMETREVNSGIRAPASQVARAGSPG